MLLISVLRDRWVSAAHRVSSKLADRVRTKTNGKPNQPNKQTNKIPKFL